MKVNYQFTEYIPIAGAFVGDQFEKLKHSILAIMMRQKDMLFKRGQAPDGSAWAPLSQGTIKAKDKKIKNKKKKGMHAVLVDTGALKNSITQDGAPYGIGSTEGNEVSLGTNIPYAAVHQFGATITTNRIFGKELKKPIEIVIPARPFIGIGSADSEKIVEKVSAFLDRESGWKK